MTKITITVVFVCFIFGLRNAYSDQSKQVEDIVTASNVEQETGSPNERAGFPRRPAMNPMQLKLSPMPLQSQNQNQYNLVECYACTNCENIFENTPKKMCPFTPDTQKQGRCVVYTEKYKQMKDPWYVRGCASERGTCSEIGKAYESTGRYVELVNCNECEGDKCNGSPRSMVDVTVAVITLAILPIFGKCTLA